MKKHIILAGAVAVLIAGCSQSNDSGGSAGSSAERSTGQGVNSQTQQSVTIQPGTTTNTAASTNR